MSMTINATITHTTYEPVSVSLRSVVDFLRKDLATRLGMRSDSYINSAGQWEHWDDTGHGSGITNKLRAATEEERSTWEALNTIADSFKHL